MDGGSVIADLLDEFNNIRNSQPWTIDIMGQHRLCHDQDSIHAEIGCVEMCNFNMAALVFLIGHVKSKNPCPCGNHTFPSEMPWIPSESRGATQTMFPWPKVDNPAKEGYPEEGVPVTIISTPSGKDEIQKMNQPWFTWHRNSHVDMLGPSGL